MTITAGLCRLIYVSRNALPGSADQIEDAIAAILATARRNNARAGVTGALLYNPDCFAQVLEGESSGVQATYARIACDSRHRQTEVLCFEPIARRDFADWSMASAGRVDDARARFDRLAFQVGRTGGTGAAQVTDLLRHAALGAALV
jgi:hypothetical protein